MDALRFDDSHESYEGVRYTSKCNNLCLIEEYTRTKKIISNQIITDGTEKQIMIPYGLQVNPETKEIYISDAQNYVVTGYIYCFTPEGKLKWKTTAGNIPAHIAFILKNYIFEKLIYILYILSLKFYTLDLIKLIINI